MERGIHTQSEILSQPAAWADALAVVNRERPALEALFQADYDQVLFTGCGSTYYLSLAAAALFQGLTGRSARATTGGELLLNPETVLRSGRTLLVAISRSGTTTETVRAVEKFKQDKRGPVVVISNYDEVLSRSADTNLVISAGQEESVAQTRSFSSMFVAATALAASAAGEAGLLHEMEKLPEAGQRILTRYAEQAREIGENLGIDRFYFLGSGYRYGLACEANLKMKEMTLTHSEPFHFLEFRHGPMSMVTGTTVMTGLVSDKNSGHERAVLDEMQALGGKIFALSEAGPRISLESGISESVRGVLYLPVLQLMAYYRSMAKGLNPDHPNNLTSVVKLNI